MKKTTFSLLIIAFCYTTVTAQKCKNALFLKRDSNVVLLMDSTVTWFKFKAKGSKLQLLINWIDSDSAVDYTLYDESSCSKNAIINWPVREMRKGVRALTEELWQLTMEHGNCVCVNCLSKVKMQPSDVLKVEQEQFYYLKIYGNNGPLSIRLNWNSIDSTKRVFGLNSSDDALELGLIYQLKTIQFIPSKTMFINKNTPLELDSLFHFLQEHPTVKIEVVGHVNGPFSQDLDSYQKLSIARAKKIKDYLVEKGLSEARVSFKGKGNTEMKFPSPKEEWQAQENRRVEIVITDL